MVLDPSATAGGAVSNSIDPCIVGSRLYIDVPEGSPCFGCPAGLLARSAVSDTDLFLVDAEGLGAPVFSSNRAFGAVPVEDAVVVFDGFFGEVVRVLAAPGVKTLVRDAVGAGFLAFLESGELRRHDFETGALLGSLGGLGTGGDLAVNAAGTEGYVTLLPPALRRVDLATLADLGSVPLGPPGSTQIGAPIVRIAPGGTTVDAAAGVPTPTGLALTLSHVDLAGAVPTVASTPLGTFGSTYHSFGSTLADRFLAWQEDSCPPFGIGGSPFKLVSAGLDAPSTPIELATPLPPVGSGCIKPHAAAQDGALVWMVDRCCQEFPKSDEHGGLWRLDLATQTWSAPIQLLEGDDVVAVVDDPFGHRVFAVKSGLHLPGFPAKLYAIDTESLALSEQSFSLMEFMFVGAVFHAEVVP